MTPGGASAGPTRHRGALLAGLAAAVVVGGLVVAVVVAAGARRDRVVAGEVDRPAPTTTLAPPVVSGGGSPSGSDLEGRACTDIPLAFPLPPRSCRMAVPTGLAPAEQVPAVILLHGLNTSAEAAASHGRWRDAAAERGFVLVLPEGQAGSWNAGSCCGLARQAGVDDVGYLRAVLDQVANQPEVDPERIAVVGESNGGMMAHTFGCAEAGRLLGIASVYGTPVSSCRPATPIPVLHVHGTADEVVPYEGGVSLAALLVGARFAPVPDAMDDVAAAMGCADGPRDSTEGEVTTSDWTGCGPATVRLVTVGGMSHEWPRDDPYDATGGILDFLGVRG